MYNNFSDKSFFQSKFNTKTIDKFMKINFVLLKALFKLKFNKNYTKFNL